MVQHLGRTPALIYTDHANIVRLHEMPLARLDPKIYRWNNEVRAGGSIMRHRPGTAILHRGPDGTSRNPEGRDQLLLKHKPSWEHYRAIIKGIDKVIEDDEFEAEETVDIENMSQDLLEPVPYETLEAAGVFVDEATEAIKRNSLKKAKAAKDGEAETVKMLCDREPRAPASAVLLCGFPQLPFRGRTAIAIIDHPRARSPGCSVSPSPLVRETV